MTSKHKLIREYLKKAQKNCPRKLRKHLDNGLKYSLSEFCDSQGDVTMEEIEEKFGKPEQYAAEYLSLLDTDGITKRLYNSRKMKFTLLFAVIVFFIATVGTMVYIVKWYEDKIPAYVYIQNEIEENFYE